MTDEIDKNRNYPLRFHEASGKEPRKIGIFERAKALLPFFRSTTATESSLVGRIHDQLQRDAHKIREQLQVLKDSLRSELEGQGDGELWASFEAVVNPLLREYGSIEKKLMTHQESVEDKTSTLQIYNDWIEKAKLWVALAARPNDRECVIRAVVEHTMRVSDSIIDRDLKTLKEYAIHEVHTIGLDEETSHWLMMQIEEALLPFVEGLLELKQNKPADLKLEHLQAWKSHLNEARNHHYNSALHTIDIILSHHSPEAVTEEEMEHLKEIFHRVAFLEEQIPLYLSDLEKLDPTDLEQVGVMKESGMLLEAEIHLLHQDLRLTPELVDRISNLMERLKQAMIRYLSQ